MGNRPKSSALEDRVAFLESLVASLEARLSITEDNLVEQTMLIGSLLDDDLSDWRPLEELPVRTAEPTTEENLDIQEMVKIIESGTPHVETPIPFEEPIEPRQLSAFGPAPSND